MTARVWCLAGIERQEVIFVLEKNHGLARGAECERGVFGRVHDGHLDFRERHLLRRVEHAELHACGEEALE